MANKSERSLKTWTVSYQVCKLIYLPPYLPDYNPIEQAFLSIKSYLHPQETDLSMTAIVRACQNITPDKASGYFWASGYPV